MLSGKPTEEIPMSCPWLVGNKVDMGLHAQFLAESVCECSYYFFHAW